MEKKCRQYSTALKLKCIMEREAGKSYSQIGRENNVHYATVMKLCRQAQQPSIAIALSARWAGKDKIFKERYDDMDQETAIAPEDIGELIALKI